MSFTCKCDLCGKDMSLLAVEHQDMKREIKQKASTCRKGVKAFAHIELNLIFSAEVQHGQICRECLERLALDAASRLIASVPRVAVSSGGD